MRDAIIGVSVKDTTAETTMVTASYRELSEQRPTTSPMKNSGMSTAINETVSD